MNALELVKAAKSTGGFYKGQPASPDSVKFTTDFQGIKIKVDRPKGFIQVGTDSKGAEWKRKYLVDYGFIPKTLGGDDDGLDVFIGPNPKSRQAFWAVQRKEDGSFDEYKVFLGFDNRDEAMASFRAHIPKKYFGRMITTTVDMMKAMIGNHPEEVVTNVKTTPAGPTTPKTAAISWGAFFGEVSKLADTTDYGEYLDAEAPQEQPVIPPLSSFSHPAHKYLKQNLVNALIQGAIGVGSAST